MYRADDPRRYTPRDIAEIHRLRACGWSHADIAETLGRSIGSIRGTVSYYEVRKAEQ